MVKNSLKILFRKGGSVWACGCVQGRLVQSGEGWSEVSERTKNQERRGGADLRNFVTQSTGCC